MLPCFIYVICHPYLAAIDCIIAWLLYCKSRFKIFKKCDPSLSAWTLPAVIVGNWTENSLKPDKANDYFFILKSPKKFFI